MGKVKTGVYVMPPFLHRDVKDLISRMLVVDPDKRISMDEIREHPWYTTNPPKSQPTKPLTKVSKNHFIRILITNGLLSLLFQLFKPLLFS